jgi:hypothetical protein
MSTDEQTTAPESDETKSAQDLAKEKDEESEQAKKEIEDLEQGDPPKDLADWPSGPAKYETFGLDDDAYGEGATGKLGPANLARHEDGSVSIDGEKVDNPDDYKGEPIGGGIDSDGPVGSSEDDSDSSDSDGESDSESDSGEESSD